MSNVIPFPKVHRNGQSPTLAELTRKAPVKVEPLTDRLRKVLRNFGGVK